MGSDELLLKYFKGNELAAGVWKKKYALEHEVTPDDMHKRMAKEFARIEESYKIVSGSKKFNDTNHLLSKYGQTIYKLDEQHIYKLFKDFKYVIPQGSVMSQLGSSSIGSLSNCFVLGQPVDSYGGIFQKDQETAQLEKRRGGVGLDISTLRPSGVATSNAAKSSTGAVSFMHRFSRTTEEVAQNGRRGALMLSMDVNHPDIMEFIVMKRDLSKVTGANISVKLNDEFMKAVEADEDYILRFPCTTEPDFDSGAGLCFEEYGKLCEGALGWYKKIRAREYWNEIIKSAHNVAEPGLMFWDTMTGYSPDGVYPQYAPVTTNPCSEIAMQPYDACRLMAMNLYSFVDNPFTPEAKFNLEKFYEYNYEAMRLSDDLVDLELEHIDRILAKIEEDPEDDDIKMTEYSLWQEIKKTAKASRRTGLGFTGLADTLAALNLKYDSVRGIELTEAIMKTKMESELDCTIDMAITRGTFTGWDTNLEFVGVNIGVGCNDFYQHILDNYPKQARSMSAFGRRNVSWSTVAPTGSLSILAEVTSGMEPLFLPFYTRRVKINVHDKDSRVDFTDLNGVAYQEFQVLHPKFRDWLILNYTDEDTIGTPEEAPKEMLQLMFKKSPWYGSTANDIDWKQRVKMQSTIQQYISHSISSTINLPENVSEQEVNEIYMEAWKQGVKGITVYRDGSRSGILVSDTKTKESFEYKDAPKRPKSLKADIHFATLKGDKFTIIIGLLDNKPYEVFLTEEHLEIDKDNIVTKKRKGLYETKEGFAVTTYENEEVMVITRLISTSLRHGADIKFIVEQLNKISGDMFSFAKVISRVLKKYIPENAKSTVKCDNPDCTGDGTNVVFEEGCQVCKDCGHGKCG